MSVGETGKRSVQYGICLKEVMIDVSIIIPVYNGEKWIDNCMNSIAAQTAFDAGINIEIVVFNDGSTDRSDLILENWANYFKTRNISFHLTGSNNSGVGAAKNGAIKRSQGNYLCFQDIDDVMHPDRISFQYEAAKSNQNALIGSRICREPANSTPRLVRWANNLTPFQLKTQIYTSNGPTLLMPTWFCHRSVFEKVGGFSEEGHGTPEDLIFFYSHIDLGGELYRVDKELVVYSYHKDAATFSVTREKIRQVQLNRLEKCVLSNWKTFMVWNAGRWGRRLLRSLTPGNLHKVTAVCDVDKNKIGTILELYCPIERVVKRKLPIIHFLDAKPPLIICVKLDLTNGQFETNLNSLNLIEGVDYVLFN